MQTIYQWNTGVPVSQQCAFFPDHAGTPIMMDMDALARKLLDGKNFATIATLNADGSPQTSVMWVKRDGDSVLFSTRADRQKARNLRRDPRLSLSVFDPENPYRYVEIRGRAELTDDPDKTLPRELSHKYVDADPPYEPAELLRVIVRVVPDKVITFGA
ncbi:PPOX class F420-dependent oxidoreductase [Fodinicola acaciae]|uniref:PPOX class F420-dependent oxidoreductase n=1 Tax=Fodinicola acaciae TaxID=2681555 RepID=UPI001FEAD916|nr:PPOX class F420-dependent oxidoreductase [Fodinicola acaciae]